MNGKERVVVGCKKNDANLANVRENEFVAPSSLSIRRPNDNLRTYWHLRNTSSYSDVMCMTISTIIL